MNEWNNLSMVFFDIFHSSWFIHLQSVSQKNHLPWRWKKCIWASDLLWIIKTFDMHKKLFSCREHETFWVFCWARAEMQTLLVFMIIICLDDGNGISFSSHNVCLEMILWWWNLFLLFFFLKCDSRHVTNQYCFQDFTWSWAVSFRVKHKIWDLTCAIRFQCFEFHLRNLQNVQCCCPLDFVYSWRFMVQFTVEIYCCEDIVLKIYVN